MAGCSPEDFIFCHILGTLADGRVLGATNNDRRSTTNPDGYTTEVFVFNPATETWTQTANINDLQASGQGVVLDAAGGACGSHCGKFLSVGRFKSSLYTP